MEGTKIEHHGIYNMFLIALYRIFKYNKRNDRIMIKFR